MTPSRWLEAERNQTAIARKVLYATPLEEPWSSHQIFSELVRTNKRVEFNTLQGCLDTLVRAGLVKEGPPGRFIQVRPKMTLKVAATSMPDAPAAQAAAPVESSPFDQFAEISNALRKQAAQMSELAQEIDDAALDYQERYDAAVAASSKFQQLQALLKSVAG